MNAHLLSTFLTSAGPVPVAVPPGSVPSGTFCLALERLDQLPGLTHKVRRNLQGAIRTCAESISAQGVAATVDIPAIEDWIDRMSPAQLGFKHAGSFSAFRSNLWRALKLTGHPVPLHRYAAAALSEPWAALQAKIKSPRMRTNLRRFMHFASQRDVPPAGITETFLLEYRLDLAQTCSKRKADQTFRNTVLAWNCAVEILEGWPCRRLDCGIRQDRPYVLPWSDLPSSYHDDVAAFINNFDVDSYGPIPGGGLRACTKANYRGALRRAASILVHLGAHAESITSLRRVVEPDNVRRILEFLGRRNGEKRGGHAGYMALLLFVVARDHVGVKDAELKTLKEDFVDQTADTRRGKMADRTRERLSPFDDPIVLKQFYKLPHCLVQSVISRPVDISTAKSVRLALAMDLQLETALPPGKVVALDLDVNFIAGENPDDVCLTIPSDEFDNRPGFKRQLKPSTAEIWRLYIGKYRVIHLGKPCRWLFPRADGSHWTQCAAYIDLHDICDRRLHLDLTPRIIRLLPAKAILDRVPDGHVIVQQALGYKQLLTVQTYFKKLRRTITRGIYHRSLEDGATGVSL
jgi:hypothetical protein